MLHEVLAAFALLALCVIVHAGGMAILIWQHPLPSNADSVGRFGIAYLLVKYACWLLTLHLVEIALWAVFYRWQNCLPDLETAFYFSGATYATVGYGDVVLPHGWRLLGPMEGLTGILMCGLSTGIFFVVVSQIFRLAGRGNLRENSGE